MSGTGTAAEPDTNSVLEVEKIAEVDFGMISGTRVGAVSVGTTSDGRVWLTAQDALQFACGGASDARAQQKLASPAKTPSPLKGGKGSGSKRLVCRKPGSGQIQCTPWRNFAPFTTSTFIDIHASAQAWENAGDRQWVRDT